VVFADLIDCADEVLIIVIGAGAVFATWLLQRTIG
jgi:hypothetical protein